MDNIQQLQSTGQAKDDAEHRRAFWQKFGLFKQFERSWKEVHRKCPVPAGKNGLRLAFEKEQLVCARQAVEAAIFYRPIPLRQKMDTNVTQYAARVIRTMFNAQECDMFESILNILLEADIHETAIMDMMLKDIASNHSDTSMASKGRCGYVCVCVYVCIYVCMYACMCVCVCMSVSMYKNLRNMYTSNTNPHVFARI